MESRQEFLARVSAFEALEPDELEDLAAIAQERIYPEGAVIAYQRDVADEMYVVRSGRLISVALSEDGQSRQWRRYMAGDVIGDTWLFSAHTHPATIKADRESRILVIRRDPFLRFMAEHPDVLDDLKFSAEALDEARHSTLALPSRRYGSVSLMPDEIVHYESRRSIYYFLLRALAPALGIVLVPALIFLTLRSLELWSAWGFWAYLLTFLPSVFLILWVLYLALDWSNDWFVITNKHLIHYELDLRTFSSSVSKIPVDQIQSVEVEKSNLWANLFNVGVARITTAAQSTALIFNFIDNPDAVRDTIVGMQQQVTAVEAGREQATMRRSVEQHFHVDEPYEVVGEEEELSEEEEELYEWVEEPPSFFERVALFWEAFSRSFRTRVEVDDSIVYRKHVFVLARRVAYPVLALLFFLALTAAFFYWQVGAQLLPFMLIPILISLGFLIWRFEDWRNDTYQLTNQFVVDIDRRPFGFGESRKQAELGNVQNVNADRPYLLATLFNYGFVEIETAGATADIIFENVAEPNQVQADIFRRRELFRQQMRRRQREAQREEYAVLLDVYHQANEQKRIPRRTPTGDLETYRPEPARGFVEEEEEPEVIDAEEGFVPYDPGEPTWEPYEE
jgi:CRP-like cAMP-binding protein/uncharacterized membrane protein YdbT with pleckstrin-like domain